MTRKTLLLLTVLGAALPAYPCEIYKPSDVTAPAVFLPQFITVRDPEVTRKARGLVETMDDEYVVRFCNAKNPKSGPRDEECRPGAAVKELREAGYTVRVSALGEVMLAAKDSDRRLVGEKAIQQVIDGIRARATAAVITVRVVSSAEESIHSLKAAGYAVEQAVGGWYFVKKDGGLQILHTDDLAAFVQEVRQKKADGVIRQAAKDAETLVR